MSQASLEDKIRYKFIGNHKRIVGLVQRVTIQPTTDISQQA